MSTTTEQPDGAQGDDLRRYVEASSALEATAARRSRCSSTRRRSSRSTTSWTCSSAASSTEPAGVPRHVHLRRHGGRRPGSSSSRSSARSSPRTLWSMLLRAATTPARCSCGSSGTCRSARSARSSAAIDEHLVRPLPDVRRPVHGLAGGQRHPALHPRPRGARARLRPGQPGLPGLHEPGLHRPRRRPARLARGAARQAVRGQARASWASSSTERKRAHGRLPRADPHPGDARADRQGPVPRGAGADRGLQPAARRHRPRLPAGAAVPGRVPPDKLPIAIGQLEWFLPQREKLVDPGGAAAALRRAPRPVGGWRPSRPSRSSAPGRPGSSTPTCWPPRASRSPSSRRSTPSAACCATASPSSACPTS